jgi:hypothetical protein
MKKVIFQNVEYYVNALEFDIKSTVLLFLDPEGKEDFLRVGKESLQLI